MNRINLISCGFINRKSTIIYNLYGLSINLETIITKGGRERESE